MSKGLSSLDLKQQYPRDIATLNLFKVVSRINFYGNINNDRRGSTPVSTVLRKSVRFFIK